MTAICGMIGAYASAPEAGAHMDAMLRALGDRAATWVDPDRRCRLGVARRHGESEPRVLEDRGLVAVVDGRAFDRGDPASADLRLVQAFASDGAKGLAKLDAQYAIAVWDGRPGRLVLARDGLGVRSLYYHEGHDGLVFASTIEALLCHPGVPREVDERAVSLYLTFLSVPTPRTLFRGIGKLPPGTDIVCGVRGIARIERAWSLFDQRLDEVDDMAHYVDRVRDLHREAVATRVASGPMAALLSGGNDSSANVARMAQLGVGPIHTFTVGLAELEGDAKFSDLVHARKVAELVGTQHHERLISATDFIATMPRVAAAQDDLVSEPSSVFLFHALDMVRELRLPIVITGEANDEISCGHGAMIHYRDGYYRRWRPLMALPRILRKIAAGAAALLSPQYADVLTRAAHDDAYFWSFELGWTDHDKPEILSAGALERTRDTRAGAIVAQRASAIGARRDYLDHVIGIMMQDYYLGNLMLGKLEQLSSRLGIEARCPYASPAYVQFVYNIPARFKARDGEVKAFFKQAIRGLLPDEIVYRPKQGFRTPTPELFRGPFGAWAEPHLLETGLTRTGVLRRDTLARLLDEHRQGRADRSTRLWTALVLNLWHERWIRQSSDSAAFAAATT